MQLLNPEATCDVPTILSSAQQFDGLTDRQIKVIITQLLCDILGGGGGGSTWNCVEGECVDPGDGTGTYSTLAACQAACEEPPAVSYNCVDGSCVDPGDGSGTYSTLEECEAACAVPASYNCVDGVCVDPGDGSGAYATLEECEAECGVVPPASNEISFAFWMEMLSQPDLAGADIISGYDFDLWDDPSGSRQSRIRLRCVAVGGGADTYTFQVTITQGVASNTGTSSAVAMPVRTWHHVAVIYDGDTGFASIYVDTVLVGASSGTPVTLTSQPFGLFNATNATQTPAALLDAYACLQDMTGVWVGHALDGAELAVLYGGGTGFNGPPWTGITTPTAWWDFDDAGRIDATENFVDSISGIELDPSGSIAQLEGLLGGFAVIKTSLMRIVETEVIADFAYTA